MRGETDTNINLEKGVVISQEIERLSAAVRMPGFRRGTVLFIGWDKDGKSVVGSENTTLSEQAKTSYNIAKAVSFPYDRDMASLPLEPVEFIGSSKPFDDRSDLKVDTPLTQDTLTYWVTKGGGNSEQIQVKELDMLNAILSGQVVWQDFNENSTSSQDTVKGLSMYNIFFPSQKENDGNVMYVLSFRSPMKNESNESMYKQFLIQTLKTLAKIDSDQPVDKRKGYLEAIELRDDDESTPEGGLLAVGVMDILRQTGMYNMSDASMDRIRKESEGKGIAAQMKIILNRLGLYNLPGNKIKPGDLDSYSVDALLAVIGTAYELANRAINGGRRRSSSSY